MSLKGLTTLTNFPVVSSGGALQRNYTTHLNQNPYSELFELGWQQELSGGLISSHNLVFYKPNTGGGKQMNFENLKLRSFCHFLLDYVPDEGLDEIKESLEEAIKFYLSRQKTNLTPASHEGFDVIMGDGFERLVFEITED